MIATFWCAVLSDISALQLLWRLTQKSMNIYIIYICIILDELKPPITLEGITGSPWGTVAHKDWAQWWDLGTIGVTSWEFCSQKRQIVQSGAWILLVPDVETAGTFERIMMTHHRDTCPPVGPQFVGFWCWQGNRGFWALSLSSLPLDREGSSETTLEVDQWSLFECCLSSTYLFHRKLRVKCWL